MGDPIGPGDLTLDVDKGQPEVLTPAPAPKAGGHHHGCPRCGSARIRRSRLVPLWLTRPVTRRRLYRCSSCGWRGWKHRLEHRRKGSQDQHRRKRDRLTWREVLFFVVFLAGFIWWATTQSVSCRPGDDVWQPPPLGLHLDPAPGALPPLA